MKSPFLAAAIAVSVFLTSATSSFAVEYRGITMEQLRSLLDAQGISHRMADTDYITTGTGLNIWLTKCNSVNVCGEIRLSRTFRDVRPTLEAVNRWNWTKRVPEASVTDDGKLHMEMWLSATGMTDTIFYDTAAWFENAWRNESFWAPYYISSGV